MEGLFSEHIVLKPGARGDLDGAETARISVKDLHKLAVIINVASLANDLVCTLRQHDAASAGNSKDLTSVNPSYVKTDAASVFTKKAAADAAAVTFAELNGAAGMAVLEVLSEELDVNNGFSYVSVQFTTTAARIGSAHYASHDHRSKPSYAVSI